MKTKKKLVFTPNFFLTFKNDQNTLILTFSKFSRLSSLLQKHCKNAKINKNTSKFCILTQKYS